MKQDDTNNKNDGNSTVKIKQDDLNNKNDDDSAVKPESLPQTMDFDTFVAINYNKPLSFYLKMILQEMIKHKDAAVQRQLVEIQLLFARLPGFIEENKDTPQNSDAFKTFVKLTIKDHDYRTKATIAIADKNWDVLKYYMWYANILAKLSLENVIKVIDMENKAEKEEKQATTTKSDK